MVNKKKKGKRSMNLAQMTFAFTGLLALSVYKTHYLTSPSSHTYSTPLSSPHNAEVYCNGVLMVYIDQ
jgi:hypothetical protein